MSHVVSLNLIIKDLEALKVAAAKLGLEFVEGQKTYKWYGKWVDDYGAEDAAYIKGGHDPKDYGKCLHALRVKGNPHAYECGIVASKNNPGAYELIFDFFGSYGRALENVIGKDAAKLKQPYAVEVAKKEALRKGFRLSESTKEDGTVVLRAIRR